MKEGLRYLAGGIAGVVIGVLVFLTLVSVHPIFGQLAPSGLIPWIAAGIVSGATAGALAPRYKLEFACCLGILVTAVLLAFLLRNGWSHFDRNPLMWYAPVWLLPAYALGGCFSRRVWRVA